MVGYPEVDALVKGDGKVAGISLAVSASRTHGLTGREGLGDSRVFGQNLHWIVTQWSPRSAAAVLCLDFL